VIITFGFIFSFILKDILIFFLFNSSLNLFRPNRIFPPSSTFLLHLLYEK
jgi:hypothetical protein